MVTVDGRLVHVDFGWALGKEPLDAMLIHFAVQGRHLVIHGQRQNPMVYFSNLPTQWRLLDGFSMF